MLHTFTYWVPCAPAVTIFLGLFSQNLEYLNFCIWIPVHLLSNQLRKYLIPLNVFTVQAVDSTFFLHEYNYDLSLSVYYRHSYLLFWLYLSCCICTNRIQCLSYHIVLLGLTITMTTTCFGLCGASSGWTNMCCLNEKLFYNILNSEQSYVYEWVKLDELFSCNVLCIFGSLY
jgi:hypothetical protein